MTPEQTAASAAFESGLIAGVAAVGVPGGGGGAEQTEPSQVPWYKSQGHLERRRSRRARRTGRAGLCPRRLARRLRRQAHGGLAAAESPAADPAVTRRRALVATLSRMHALPFCWRSRAPRSCAGVCARCARAGTRGPTIAIVELPYPLGVLIVAAALLALMPLALIERLAGTEVFYPAAAPGRRLRARGRLPGPDRRHARRSSAPVDSGRPARAAGAATAARRCAASCPRGR